MTVNGLESSNSNQMGSKLLFGARTRRGTNSSSSSIDSSSRAPQQPKALNEDLYQPRHSRKRAQSLPNTKPSLLQRAKTGLEDLKHKTEPTIHNVEHKLENRIVESFAGNAIFPRDDHETRRHHRKEKAHLRTISPHTEKKRA